jgi:hypothetical protein
MWIIKIKEDKFKIGKKKLNSSTGLPDNYRIRLLQLITVNLLSQIMEAGQNHYKKKPLTSCRMQEETSLNLSKHMTQL